MVIETQIESDTSHLGHFLLNVANFFRTSCLYEMEVYI